METSQRPSAVRVLALAALCMAATIAYICRQSIGVAESTIRSDLGLSTVAMSWVMSSFFLAYALGQIPIGWLGNRWGSRAAIPIFAVTWSLATGAMGLATGATFLVLARVTNGIAQAGLFPCCTTSIAHWFPLNRRAIACGSLGAFMSVGGAIGVALTGSLVWAIGWRATFALYGLAGLAFAGAFWFWFRNHPREHQAVNQAELALIERGKAPPDDPAQVTKGSAAVIFLAPGMWWICGQQFCRAAGEIFFGSWFATYLQQTRDVPVHQSGWLNSMPIIALVLGALAGGTLSDMILQYTGNRRLARSGVAAVSSLLCAAFVFAAYFIQDPVLAVATISLGTFCAAVSSPCAYTVTIDMGGRYVAILFATMNMIGNLGSFSFIRLVPSLLEWTGSWDAVLFLFGLLYVAAAAFWLLVNPNTTLAEQSLLKSSAS